MKKIAVLGVGLVSVVVTAAALGASVTTFKVAAKLTVAAEVPKVHGPAAAGGTFTGTVKVRGTVRTLTWKLTYAHLSGAGIAAHIHKGRPGKPGPVVVTLCGPCHLSQTGISRVSAAVVKAIKSGSAYVNVHTRRNKAGEIRGQVKVVR